MRPESSGHSSLAFRLGWDSSSQHGNRKWAVYDLYPNLTLRFYAIIFGFLPAPMTCSLTTLFRVKTAAWLSWSYLYLTPLGFLGVTQNILDTYPLLRADLLQGE